MIFSYELDKISIRQEIRAKNVKLQICSVWILKFIETQNTFFSLIVTQKICKVNIDSMKWTKK